MSEYKNYRKIMKEMNRKQLKEEYSKARKKILSFNNSNEMFNALDQFEFSIIYLDKLDCREDNKQNIIIKKEKEKKLEKIKADFKKAEPYMLILLQQDLEKNLKIIREKKEEKYDNSAE